MLRRSEILPRCVAAIDNWARATFLQPTLLDPDSERQKIPSPSRRPKSMQFPNAMEWTGGETGDIGSAADGPRRAVDSRTPSDMLQDIDGALRAYRRTGKECI